MSTTSTLKKKPVVVPGSLSGVPANTWENMVKWLSSDTHSTVVASSPKRSS